MENKGKLLYESEWDKKYKLKIKLKILGFITLFLGGGLFIIFSFPLGYVSFDSAFQNISMFIGGIVMVLFGLYVIIHINYLVNLKVYENGIRWPELRSKQIIIGGDNFLPFKDIQTIFLNPGKDFMVFLITKTEKQEFVSLSKSVVDDLEKTLKILEGEVEIDREKQFIHDLEGIKEIYNPEDLENN